MDPLSNYQIEQFFLTHDSITKQACHDKAITIAGGGTAAPTPGQGAQSYTVLVINGMVKLIVQFRNPKYPLDVGLMDAAKKTYGQLVPSCEYLQGQMDPLHVYRMNYMSGVGFNVIRDQFLRPENFHLLERTIQDFAGFCAAAWCNRPASIAFSSNSSIQLEYASHLKCLSDGLPDRFRHQLDKLNAQLPSLFQADFPMVINHWDLLENNMHVDVKTGSLTGVVDWRDAKVGPFGTQFWGLENLLGVRTGSGMRFHLRHVELRQRFWETLYAQIGSVSEDKRAAIRAARTIGIFFANDDFENKFPVEEGTRELAVLESMTLDLDETKI